MVLQVAAKSPQGYVLCLDKLNTGRHVTSCGPVVLLVLAAGCGPQQGDVPVGMLHELFCSR